MKFDSSVGLFKTRTAYHHVPRRKKEEKTMSAVASHSWCIHDLHTRHKKVTHQKQRFLNFSRKQKHHVTWTACTMLKWPALMHLRLRHSSQFRREIPGTQRTLVLSLSLFSEESSQSTDNYKRLSSVNTRFVQLLLLPYLWPIQSKTTFDFQKVQSGSRCLLCRLQLQLGRLHSESTCLRSVPHSGFLLVHTWKAAGNRSSICVPVIHMGP